MTVYLTLICSGATAATRAAAFPLDEPLDDKARTSAVALGRRLQRPTAALVSPARRAIETAAALGLTASVDPRLRDWDLGRWAGRSLADIGLEEATGLSAWLSDPQATPHGGEALQNLLARVARWLDEHLGESRRLVAVTHPAVIRAAVLQVLSAPSHAFWLVDVEPLSLTALSSNGARWTLRQATLADR